MTRTLTRNALLTLLGWCLLAPAGWTHGLLARVRTEANTIVGTAYYSSGEPAGGEWVQVFDVSRAETLVAEFAAGAGGEFRFDGVAGHRYRVSIHGDEGHSIDLAIAIEDGARASLVEDAPATVDGGITELPAWLVVGGALCVVTAAACVFRVREYTRGRKPVISNFS